MGKQLTINKFYEIRFGVAHGFVGNLLLMMQKKIKQQFKLKKI
ncbi:Uncharacterised protein [Clostridium carnis]|uniref:Uncharacterized protein n=1 Tax=Clostridium carnis TaxID=1530 RepID=A0ABY6SXN4_9CLOT|nr:hypothetical protein [Clostridium carnis]VDG73420.1 Uncharacterised protein [Clostridium carnis]